MAVPNSIVSPTGLIRLVQPDVHYPDTETGDDASALQAAADAIQASGRTGTLCLGAKQVWHLKRAITLDPRFVAIDGRGATLDWTGASNLQAAVIVSATSSGGASPVASFGPTTWNSLKLIVPTTFPGVLLAAPVTTDGFNSAVSFHNVAIVGGSNCLRIGQNSYLSNFQGCAFIGSTDACVFRTGGANSGENISFYACTFANAFQFVKNTGPNADFYFFGCSFDYWRSRLCFFQSGTAEFHGCHFEGRYVAGQPVFELDSAATLKFIGGDMGISGPPPPHLFTTYTNKGQVFWCGVTGTPAFTQSISGYMPGFFTSKPLIAEIPAAMPMNGEVVADPLQGDYFSGTLQSDTLLADPRRSCGQGNTLTFALKQATGSGPFRLRFGPSFHWPGGTAPTMPSAAGSTLKITATYDAEGDRYLCDAHAFPAPG